MATGVSTQEHFLPAHPQTLNLDVPTGITRCSRQKPLAPPYGAVDFLKELSVLYQKSCRVAVYSTPAGIRAFKIGTHYPFVFTIVKTNNP